MYLHFVREVNSSLQRCRVSCVAGDGFVPLPVEHVGWPRCLWSAGSGECFQADFAGAECFMCLSEPSAINETYLLMIVGMSRINLWDMLKTLLKMWSYWVTVCRGACHIV